MSLEKNTIVMQEVLETINNLPNTALLYTHQELTEEQQAQARVNIGAQPEDVIVTATATDISDSTTLLTNFNMSFVEIMANSSKNIYLSIRQLEEGEEYEVIRLKSHMMVGETICMFWDLFVGSTISAMIMPDGEETSGILTMTDIQTKIEGTSDQIVGFDENGNAVAIAKPTLTVNLTYDGTNNVWTADKTFAEIQTAITNGTSVTVSTANMKLPLASHDASFLIFSGTVCTDKCYSRTVTISESAITYVEKPLLTEDNKQEIANMVAEQIIIPLETMIDESGVLE